MAEFYEMPAISPTMEVGSLVAWKIAEGDTENLGDTSTLADPAIVDSLVTGRIE